jgi:simple sugar transport system permease protein
LTNFVNKLKIEKRLGVSRLSQFLSVLIAIMAAFMIAAILISMAGANVPEAFSALFAGAFSSKKAFMETLVKATPLTLTGLAVALAFRGRVWNIGAEGQFFVGAMASYWISTNLTWLPTVWLFAANIVIAFLAAAAIGLIPGVLKAKLGVDETVVTIMMNYIIRYFLSFMLSGPWQDPRYEFQMSPEIPKVSYFPVLLSNTRLHAGFIIALLAALLVYLLLQKTPLGYEMRAVGFNPIAAKFKGINITKNIIIIMALSAGIAGLAGAGEMAGLHHRLRIDISTGYGYTGILIAVMAGLNPITVIPVAILFGALVNGATRMQVLTKVPVSVVYATEAIILLFVLAAQVLSEYRIRSIRDVE